MILVIVGVSIRPLRPIRNGSEKEVMNPMQRTIQWFLVMMNHLLRETCDVILFTR